jgi:subtilisin family serine protease
VSSLRRLALVLPAFLGSLTLLSAAGTSASSQAAPSAARGLVEVVVTLPRPPLAEAIRRDRGLAARATTDRRLNLRAPASVSYLRTLASAQRRLQARIEAAIPSAAVHWRYGVVLDGMAVVVPRSQLGRLAAVPGATVWPSLTYHALLNRTPQLIGAPAVWGPTLATAGNGMKIAILDDGLDQTHVFFDPSGFAYPPGFPKGNTAYTTAKVIVAKTFAPKTPAWKYANTPFDPEFSDHATNVAGIAAGDHDTLATVGGAKVRVSGIAPRAYLGNYKVLTIPTQGFGLDGNSPEIARGIEEAVRDGMDVINLSLGEPEIEPSRDIVVQAIDNAADAGVITAVAAGNDFGDSGRGSIGSPGTAPKAITVAASTEGDSGPADVIADFSSSGPTPVSLQLKPDVTAPGVDLLSSLPRNQWSNHDWSGTSMATPHVAAAAALLKERHPEWTPAEVKSALEATGAPVRRAGSGTELSPLREGGGRIDVAQADDPLVFTDPSALSFGLVRRGTTTVLQLALTDAGGGVAPWTVSVDPQTAPHGVSLSVSAPVAAAGTALGVTLTVTADAAEGDGEGFLVLSRGTDVRRVPFWLHVEAPKLGTEKHATLLRPGVYGGNTAGKPARVSSYRYPEGSLSCRCTVGVRTNEPGPEQVFRYTLRRPVANLGAVVLSHARGVRVSPRLVAGDDENRLVGYTAIPVDINPYADYGRIVPAVGAVFPAPAPYDVVFDTPAGARPGKFTFRFWVNDVTPPRVHLLTRTIRPHQKIRLRVTDTGAGVDPASLVAHVGGASPGFSFVNGLLSLSSGTLARGAHRLTLVAADYQETKNMENTGPVLPNTRTFHATVVVR